MPGNFATFNIGSDVPTAANRDKLWYRVDASCNPLGWFIYSGGAWVRATPIGTPPGLVAHFFLTSFENILARDRARISFIDTGDTYVSPSVTLHANPFWLLCDGTAVGGFTPPDLQGRTIVGAGAGSGLTTRLYGATGGEENHLLTESELPAHTHDVVVDGLSGSPDAAVYAYTSGGGGKNTGTISNSGGNKIIAESTAAASSHNTMQPFLVGYAAIRTSRTI